MRRRVQSEPNGPLTSPSNAPTCSGRAHIWIRITMDQPPQFQQQQLAVPHQRLEQDQLHQQLEQLQQQEAELRQ